jgi:AcrR family transcriptional regulator
VAPNPTSSSASTTPVRRRGPAPGTPRAPRLPRAQREEQILTTAEEVFARRGYQLTTMEEVADRVGITKPVIYDYFGSKEGLLSATIARAREQLRSSTFAAWDAQPPGTPTEEFFRVGVRAFFDFIDAHRSAFILIQHEGAFAATAHDELEDIRAQQSEVVVEVLSHLDRFADTPRTQLTGYAEVLVGAAERVAVWRTRHPEINAPQATEIVMEAVWGGLGRFFTPLPQLAQASPTTPVSVG